jgi:DNA (cytosine-5)-methyltransferase 1
MAAYYNECDPYAAQWLRNLIAAGHIAPGDVDERSIKEVQADDLKSYAQCHFFAGIGVWSHALRSAGWPDDMPVWTGSCPCQPFSAAGKQKGFDDERHLWPVWFGLIEQCNPAIVLGEQVASALSWFDLVSADMEGAGYAIGASDLCAAGFGGAHIRQRLYFAGVANGYNPRSQGRGGMSERAVEQPVRSGSVAGRVADTASARCVGSQPESESQARDEARMLLPRAKQPDGRMADTQSERQSGRSLRADGEPQERTSEGGINGRMADTAPEQHDRGGLAGPSGRPEYSNCGGVGRANAPMLGRNAADWLYCRDGKWRPVEPGFFKVAYETAARMGQLCPEGQYQAERLIGEASERFSTPRSEILRALRQTTPDQDVCERQAGKPVSAPEAQVLLNSLFKFYGQARNEQNADYGSGQGDSAQERLRVLWERASAGGSPYRRELAQQRPDELADAMRLLSSAMARAAQEIGEEVRYTNAFASFPLAERSGDETKNRVGKLRAYGNALDDETATEFAAAVLDTLDLAAMMEQF